MATPQTKGTVANKEKVLIIEGEGSFGERLSQALRDEGYQVILVKEGTEAMKSIYDNIPSLILLDIMTPGADAYDILAKKQTEPLLAKIPAFLLSTDGTPINMNRVPEGAVKEFLISLHADPGEIVGKVNAHFKRGLAPSASTGAPGTGKKLLWVEDDKLIGTILSKKLVSSGFDLVHAKNGEEALASMRERQPDGVVLDLLLPGRSGFDILKDMNDEPSLKKIPVMILSNLSKQSDIERAKAMGARKFLVKAAVSLDQIVEEARDLCS